MYVGVACDSEWIGWQTKKPVSGTGRLDLRFVDLWSGLLAECK